MVKITCRDRRTHGACWEADVVGWKKLECRVGPIARLRPSAQLGDISLTCQHLSSHQHLPLETEGLPRSLRSKDAQGTERGPWEKEGCQFQTCCPFLGCSRDRIPLSLHISQFQTQTGHGFLITKPVLKNEKLEVVSEVEIMLIYAVSTAARIKNSFLLGKLELLTVSLPSRPPLPGFQDWWAQGTIGRTLLAITGSGALPKWKVRRQEQSLTQHV